MFSPLPYNVTETDAEFEKVLKEKINYFKESFKERYEEQEKVMEAFRFSIEHCSYNNFQKSKIVWNAAGFINLISFDLKIIASKLILAEKEWERRYFGRHAALIIHEAIADLLELFGKPFREIINELADSQELKFLLKEVVKKLNVYKNKNGSQLSRIRNFSIAHRDKDILQQLAVICELSWVEAINYVSGFDAILNDAGKFMQILLNRGYFDTDLTE